MHSEKLQKNYPLRGLSVSKDGKNKITFEKFTCQLFIILEIFTRENCLLFKNFPIVLFSVFKTKFSSQVTD